LPLRRKTTTKGRWARPSWASAGRGRRELGQKRPKPWSGRGKRFSFIKSFFLFSKTCNLVLFANF
jgi:hypothetical protein